MDEGGGDKRVLATFADAARRWRGGAAVTEMRTRCVRCSLDVDQRVTDVPDGCLRRMHEMCEMETFVMFVRWAAPA